MKHANWNDLRFLLALKRYGSIGRAARFLGVNATTVTRRLHSLEEQYKTPLLDRARDKSFVLTAVGQTVCHYAELVEQNMAALDAELAQSRSEVSGLVRISAVPMIINRVLTPQLGHLLGAHPELRVHFYPDLENLNLRDTGIDMAIRLARPQSGGHEIVAKRLGALDHGIYVAAHIPPRQVEIMDWVGYRDGLEYLPSFKWMRENAPALGGKIAQIGAGDAEGALEATAAGLGKSALPNFLCEHDPRLRRLDPPLATPDVTREIWMLSHRTSTESPRIAAVREWLQGVF